MLLKREWGYRLKVSGWRSSLVARGLRVWHHHCYGLGRCCGSGCCCGMGLITDLGTSAYCRCTHAPKKRKKKKEMGRSSRQKISKDLIKLNSTKNQLDVTDIYMLHYSKTAEHTFSSSSHVTFTKTDKFGPKNIS